MLSKPDLEDAIARRPNIVLPRTVLLGCAQALLVLLVLGFYLNLGRRDLRVPMAFGQDSLFFLMQGKSTVDNGWWWTNSRISAPFAYDARAFASNSNIDQLILWLISRFTGDAMLAMNLAWLAIIVLSGLVASFCLRSLGSSPVAAFVLGTLYAVSPYALYRGIEHFSLVIYLVPFPATLALMLAAGRPPRPWPDRKLLVLLAGCVLLGFNYVYYAFFGCLFLALAAAVGFFNYRDRRILRLGAVCVLLIGSCTALNLTPSVYSWQRHGKPIILRPKVAAEAEVYGLKIRQLVSPVFRHTFPPFRLWLDRESHASFPLETENMVSRLGFVGTLGFLGLLAVLFVRRRGVERGAGSQLAGAAGVNLAAVLLATIGGFGSLFNLLVSPDIRAYNRICPFIVFFSLFAVAVAIDWLTHVRIKQTVALGFLVIGLYDHSYIDLKSNAAAIAQGFYEVKSVVTQLERTLSDRAMVYQLPVTTFLNDEGNVRMRSYDHLKPYLVSHKTRWSYPAFSNEQVRWQHSMSRLAPPELARSLAAQGFAALWIDKFGYDDGAQGLLKQMQPVLAGAATLAEDARYVVIDLRRLSTGRGPTPAVIAAIAEAPATTDMAPCNLGPPLYNIDQIGPLKAPFGATVPSVGVSDDISVRGWAVDQPHRSSAAEVDVVIDQQPFMTYYGAPRPDVANGYGVPAYLNSTFSAAIRANRIGKGRHMLSLRVVSSDRKCFYQSPAVPINIE